MKRRWIFLGLSVALLVLSSGPEARAQEQKIGLGIFFDRSMPVMGLADRYPAAQKYGILLDYRLSSRTSLEFEYNHATLDEGKIERQSFIWPIDKKKYQSPDARSEMKLNSFLINVLARLNESAGEDVQLAPYLAIGAGFYDYRDRISGLIYPGQKGAALDTGLLIEPRKDAHTALGASFGLGMAVIHGHFGLDARARYHLILGDLRPMEAWGFESVFPIGMVDVRTAFKFYF